MNAVFSDIKNFLDGDHSKYFSMEELGYYSDEIGHIDKTNLGISLHSMRRENVLNLVYVLDYRKSYAYYSKTRSLRIYALTEQASKILIKNPKISYSKMLSLIRN